MNRIEVTPEQAKERLFEMLVHFDDFCRKNGINYSLGEGTLLGAVRHKGFIPWDDDIDILMLRSDFEKFLSCYVDGEYKVFHVNNDVNYWNYVARLSDTRTAVYFPNSKRSIHGLWLGLTPVDYIPDDESQWLRMRKRIAFWVRLCRQKKKAIPLEGGLRAFFLKCLFKLLPISCFDRAFKKVVMKYDNQKTGRLCKLNIRYEPFVFPSSVFDGYTELEFEGRRFMAVSHYDDYLKQMYGDYMTPPPVEKRETKHNYQVYYK